MTDCTVKPNIRVNPSEINSHSVSGIPFRNMKVLFWAHTHTHTQKDSECIHFYRRHCSFWNKNNGKNSLWILIIEESPQISVIGIFNKSFWIIFVKIWIKIGVLSHYPSLHFMHFCSGVSEEVLVSLTFHWFLFYSHNFDAASLFSMLLST